MGDNPIPNTELPNDMELYDGFKWPGVVPKVDWNRLTLEQKKLVMVAYRFGGYKIGSYQMVTFNGPPGSIP